MASQEERIYEKLVPHCVPQQALIGMGYPVRDPMNPNLRSSGGKVLESQFASQYQCKRCKQVYAVDADGVARERNTCYYHAYNYRFISYSCCRRQERMSKGCVEATHAHNGDLLVENYKGYVATEAKPSRDPHGHGVFALDCEMVETAYGLELARVSVLNYCGRVVYEQLVKPTNPIVNYNTIYSGLDADKLRDVTVRLADVQHKLLTMFSNKTILIGHGLDGDMKALKLFHTNFVDTVHMYPHPKGPPYKTALRGLKEDYLRISTNFNVAHDSQDDARHALQLVYRKTQISQTVG